jgi:ubiquinone/menaquinone biosynthesis C-methylase UbiE
MSPIPFHPPGSTMRTTIACLAAVSLLILALAACQSSKSAEADTSDQTSASSMSAQQKGNHDKATTADDKNHDRHHDFDKPDEYAQEWNAESRDDWQKPGQVIDLMGIKPGDTVADLGTGTGYFLPHLSKAVGANGRVLALDVSDEMLRYVTDNIVPGLAHDNLSTRKVKRQDPGLSADSVDSVLTVNTWHHIKNRVSYAEKIYRALRPGGTFVDVDYTKETPQGPPTKIKLTPQQVADELKQAGFEVQIAAESLPKQYVVVGTKPAK